MTQSMPQAEDFRAESRALFSLLETTDETRFGEKTLFKDWTINAVLQHLHFWNGMAEAQISDEAGLISNLTEMGTFKGGMRAFEQHKLNSIGGHELLTLWKEGVERTADIFASHDPKARLKWAGPDMSARSSITARLMETWAHGQEVYDHLGIVRQNQDRIRNIVVLGVNTFGWTYMTRKEQPPGPMPHLRLTAPSGEIWSYGDESHSELIEGPAEAFCQVVTQVRNVADTDLDVTGTIAKDWMSKAQCFAGPPEEPPAPGSRRTNTNQA